MYGLQAITTHNGWAMALAGALIVFSGLIVLSFTIAQLHKIIKLLEKKKKSAGVPVTQPPPEAAGSATELLIDQAALTKAYQPLVNKLEETFELADLYALAASANLPHPHLSIKALRQAHVLIFQGEGLFKWQVPVDA
jgi:hypothetical protein